MVSNIMESCCCYLNSFISSFFCNLRRLTVVFWKQTYCNSEELTLENVLWSWCMVHSSCPRRIPYLINLWSSRLVIITVISVWSSCNITEHIPQLMASTFVFLVIAEVQQGEELHVPLGVQISGWMLSIQIRRTFFHTRTLRWWTFLTFKLYWLTEEGRTAAMMYILL